MEFLVQDPPRRFMASATEGEWIDDYGVISLGWHEQVSIGGPADATPHTDIARKPWGYYLTRSCDVAQREAGWRTAIIRNGRGKTYVVMVEDRQHGEFFDFLNASGHSLLLWVDELP